MGDDHELTGRRPVLSRWQARGPVRAVVLVLHGGAEQGLSDVRPWSAAYLRMVPLARAVSAVAARHGVEVRLLRNRIRGWNEPDRQPVDDARWALDRIRAERPGVPVLLVGHSMGGRVALRVADDPAVTAVCGLAPWIEPGEDIEPVTKRVLVLAHGTLDRITSPGESFAYAARAAAVADRVARYEVMSEAHAMLLRPRVWSTVVRGFVLDALGVVSLTAWDRPADQRFRLPL